MELLLSKIKLSILPIIMFSFGIFLLLVGHENIPNYKQLSEAHGTVSKLEIYKGIRFSLNNVSENFDYSVNAPRSASLDNLLKESEQKKLPVTILYDNHSFKVPATGQIRNSVWQIESEGKVMMSFNEISSLITFWNKLGFCVAIAFLFSGIALEIFLLKADHKSFSQ